VWLLACSLLYAQVLQGDVVLVAEGYGLSRDNALLNAKRDAVERGIGTVLISRTEVKNFELQKDVILSRTLGSVKKYDVLKEEKQSDGNYYAKIKAVVSLASIKADLAALKILLASMDKPRMMVVIQEEGGKTAENAILDYLTEKQFELVDPATVAALMQKGDKLIQRAAQGDPAAAAQIGTANGAEYVLVGTVSKSTMKSKFLEASGMVSGQAHLTAKVVNCSNARIIASKSSNGAAVHVAEDVAMANATEKAAKTLMDRALFEEIVASFQDMVNNGLPLYVIIKHVDDFKTQKAVVKALEETSQVVSVSKRSFGGGRLQLSVLYKGTADTFSEAVDGKTAAGKIFSVTGISGDNVVIEMD
jgi:hypothetical protein